MNEKMSRMRSSPFSSALFVRAFVARALFLAMGPALALVAREMAWQDCCAR